MLQAVTGESFNGITDRGDVTQRTLMYGYEQGKSYTAAVAIQH